MAIPILYSLRSVRVRWSSATISIVGVAGTVGIFVAILSISRGFQATLIASGSADNAIIIRAGATTEMAGAMMLNQVKVIEDAPGVAHNSNGPLVSPEAVLIATLPLRSGHSDGNLQIRGVSPRALEVRTKVKIIQGRMFQPGLTEFIVGRNAAQTYSGTSIGDSFKYGEATWKVVGIFDAGGTAFDSEIWGDSHVVNQMSHRPENLFQSVTAHLSSPDAFAQFKRAVTADPRMTVSVSREIDYYDRQSRVITARIQALGAYIGLIMGIGAVFGSLNTMYSAISERAREIATLRALGFHSGSVVFAFVFEAMFISLLGGLLGCLVVLPLNGLTTATMNVQTYSQLAFAFRVTPALLGLGIVFALIMGFIGGLPPALRAAQRPVAESLRAL
jgi:putative ABC transport system permease protein